MANTSEKLQELKAVLAEVTDLNRAALLLEWDQETYMPRGGVESRAEQLSTLLRLAHVRFTSDEVGRLLGELEDELGGRSFDSDEASLVRVTRRDYNQARKLPPDLVAEVARAGPTARPVWEKARHDENFGLFAPYLEKNVELNRRIADAIANQADGALGFLNPRLYRIYTNGPYGTAFHDITVGDNSASGITGYSATAGWDPATGLGTPDVHQLVVALSATSPCLSPWIWPSPIKLPSSSR